jgi:hypothetical protein
MANVDMFQPVKINLSISQPQNIPLPVNNVALMSTNITVLPLVDLVKRYSDASTVGVDYGLTSPEYLFASQFFAFNQGLSYLIMVSFTVPTTPPAGYLAAAIEAGYNKAQSNGWGGFSGVAWAETSYLTNLATTLGELDAIASYAADNNMTLVTMAVIDNEDVFNQASGNILDLIKNRQYKANLLVGVHGTPTFTSDPTTPNKRSDGSCLGTLSSASKTTLGSLALFGQVFNGLVPIPAGQADTGSVLFTKEKVNALANAQLNLYVQYGQKIIFGLGFAANAAVSIEYKTVYIKLFLEQYIQEQMDAYFEPASLKYDDDGVATAYGTLNVILKQMASDRIIESNFSVTPPELDFSTPAPRILGPFVIAVTVGDTVYGISINGTVTA